MSTRPTLSPKARNTHQMASTQHSSEKAKNAARELKQYYIYYPDFPKKGIKFWDVFSLTKNKRAADLLHIILEEYAATRQGQVDTVVGLEARGFLFGPVLAYMLKGIFIPIRKKGKLPGVCLEEKYVLEYTEDIIQIQKDSIKPGQRIVIFDDCLATGGTLTAAYKLIKKCGGNIVDCVVLYNIPEVSSNTSFPVKVLLE